MDASPPEEESTTFTEPILTQIKRDLQEQIKKSANLGNLEEIAISNPSDYKALSATEFKHLKEQLALHSFLPKAPVLAEFQFLLQNKGGKLLREQFEDVWSSATLNYAAAADNFAAVLELFDDSKVAQGNKIFRAASTALLAASNVLARTLETYKQIATRQATKGSQRTTAERHRILSTEEAKSIQTTVDTASKLKKLTQPSTQPFFQRFQQRQRRPRSNYWNNRQYRGRGRRGRSGRGTPASTQQQNNS